MNANELSDYLLNFIMTVEDYDESKHEKAAIMLQQQQERVKQLEETQEYLYKTHDADKAEIEALKGGIEKLKDAYCQKDHEIKKAEQYCLDAFERGRQIGYADGMINRKTQENG